MSTLRVSSKSPSSCETDLLDVSVLSTGSLFVDGSVDFDLALMNRELVSVVKRAEVCSSEANAMVYRLSSNNITVSVLSYTVDGIGTSTHVHTNWRFVGRSVIRKS